MAVPLILAGIGAAGMVAGAVGSAKSGILNKTNTGWADKSGFNKQIGNSNQYQTQYGALADAYLRP